MCTQSRHRSLPSLTRQMASSKSFASSGSIVMTWCSRQSTRPAQSSCSARPSSVSDRLGFVKNFPAGNERQIILPKHGEHVDALLVRRPKHFNDFTFRIGVPGLPFPQLDDDFVAGVSRTAHVPGRRDIYVVRNTRIIRD